MSQVTFMGESRLMFYLEDYDLVQYYDDIYEKVMDVTQHMFPEEFFCIKLDADDQIVFYFSLVAHEDAKTAKEMMDNLYAHFEGVETFTADTVDDIRWPSS